MSKNYAEPQDSDNPVLTGMLSEAQQRADLIVSGSGSLHAIKKEAAEKKLANYFAFKTEYDARMIEVHEKLGVVSDLIKANCGDIPNSVLV